MFIFNLLDCDSVQTMKHRNLKKPSVYSKSKKLGSANYETDFLKKKCLCKYKTSTPVRFGFDFHIYEDIIFVPTKDITKNTDKKLSEAFIIASSKKDCFLFRKLKKAKKCSRKSAIKALTLILCNIM